MAAAHVLVFPWPQQGHINCMLHFATALAGAGIHVTFLHTDHNLRRLARPSAATSSRLRFLSVPDGLPDDHPRAGARPAVSDSGVASDGGFPPGTCVVADGVLSWASDIAEELGVPALAFRTASACSFLAYLSVPKLFDLGELPFPEGGDLDEPARGVPGMGAFLRRRDLPSSCRRLNEANDVDPVLHVLAHLTAHSGKARALIFNTAASLERSALAHVEPHMRVVFAIGPPHAMSAAPAAASSLWREDDGCMAWLDSQADRSVVYVSLGSLAVISHDQFTEFLSGLVSAGQPFLWVLRPDMIGPNQDAALQEATDAAGKEKARVVPWAPQRDVLRHRAVGCFLTHCGWNSTLEALSEGMPMVCWPFNADQQINSRFVGAVWRTGLDMKDVCERAVVERMVKEVMESAEIRSAAQTLARQLRQDISVRGSSATEFERLVTFIRGLGMSSERTVLSHIKQVEGDIADGGASGTEFKRLLDYI